jgi:hypothetical protein
LKTDRRLELPAKLKSHIGSERTLAEYYAIAKQGTILAAPPRLMSAPNDVGSTKYLDGDELFKPGLIAGKAMLAVHRRHDCLDFAVLLYCQFHPGSSLFTTS